MTERESHSTKHESIQCLNDRQSLNELRVICTIAGEWGKQLASHFISLPLIEANHERVK